MGGTLPGPRRSSTSSPGPWRDQFPSSDITQEKVATPPVGKGQECNFTLYLSLSRIWTLTTTCDRIKQQLRSSNNISRCSSTGHAISRTKMAVNSIPNRWREINRGDSRVGKGKMNLQQFADRHGLQVKNYAIRTAGEIHQAYVGVLFPARHRVSQVYPVTQAKTGHRAIGLRHGSTRTA